MNPREMKICLGWAVFSVVLFFCGWIGGRRNLQNETRRHIGAITLEWRNHIGWYVLDDGKSKWCTSRVPDNDDAVIIVLTAEEEFGCEIAQYAGLKIPYVKDMPSVTPIIPGAEDATRRETR